MEKGSRFLLKYFITIKKINNQKKKIVTFSSELPRVYRDLKKKIFSRYYFPEKEILGNHWPNHALL